MAFPNSAPEDPRQATVRVDHNQSTRATTIVAVGTISLGKYTLPIKLALLRMLLDASLKPVEKNAHGRFPTNTISA
jgi:hypothetical protein